MQIVFILNGITQQRCLKRIQEFVNNSYDVKAYGFDRQDGVKNASDFPIEVIGCLHNQVYSHRFSVMRDGLKKVFNSTDKKNSIYYLFGLDIVLFSKLLCPGIRYIFEESDLRHVELKYSFLRSALEVLDKRMIKKSLMTVFTSDGFVKYHFGEKRPSNIYTIPNRLNPKIVDYKALPSKSIDISHLVIGFVGAIRYKSIMFFAKQFVDTYPQHEFHFYGGFQSKDAEIVAEELKKRDNCFFHGPFKSPVDLPKIYSSIDLVLSTYDIDNINVRYAEPNKLYESIYFETPIIVSEGTFLAEKVQSLNTGFVINALDADSIDSFVRQLTEKDIEDKIKSIQAYDKSNALSINDGFFEKLKSLIQKI